MLCVHYFASVREASGRSSEILEMPAQVNNVRGLIDFLADRDPGLQTLLGDEGRLLVAVNQTIVDREHVLRGDEEIAFFPPMTGG